MVPIQSFVSCSWESNTGPLINFIITEKSLGYTLLVLHFEGRLMNQACLGPSKFHMCVTWSITEFGMWVYHMIHVFPFWPALRDRRTYARYACSYTCPTTTTTVLCPVLLRRIFYCFAFTSIRVSMRRPEPSGLMGSGFSRGPFIHDSVSKSQVILVPSYPAATAWWRHFSSFDSKKRRASGKKQSRHQKVIKMEWNL